MSESEVETDGTSGIKIPRFHGRRGEDYGLWRLRLRAACRVKGVWNVVDFSALSTTTDSTTDIAVASSRHQAKREKASGIIISALGDAPLRVVLEADDDPERMLKLLDARYASNRTVSRIAVQTQLFRMAYTDQNMSTYVDQFTSLFSQLERMGKDAAIPETHKAPMLLASIDPKCPLESTAAALRTKDVAELTWDYVATTLIDEYNARHTSSGPSGRGRKGKNRRKNKNKRHPNSSQSTSHLAHNESDSDDGSDIETTVRALAAAIKSVKSDHGSSNNYHCDFCDRDGHTEERCHLNPANPNNRLPQKVRQMLAAQAKKPANAAVVESSKKASKANKLEIVGASVEKTTVNPPRDHSSYADSGATVHCFHSESFFVPGSLSECDTRTIMLADKTTVTANRSGEVVIPFENANVRLRNVLLIPGLGYNLVSTGKLADNGIQSNFRRLDVQLSLEEDGFYIGCGSRHSRSGMYTLPDPLVGANANEHRAFSMNAQDTAQLWHNRLAHLNPRDLVSLHNHVRDVPQLVQMDDVCRACRLGKAHKLPFPGHFEQAKAVGEIIHSDIVGPLEPSWPDRYRYISTFVDGHSRYTLIGLMHHKSDIHEVFQGVSAKFRKVGGASINPNFHGPIAKIHSDGAKEYIALQNSLGGGEHNKSFSPPYTPELNAIAERVNRTMVEGALSMLIQANLPSCLWPYAVKHTIYVRNRVPHSGIGATPLESISGIEPSLKNLRVFGCTAYVLRLPRGSKFESRAVEGVYLETLDHGVFRVLVTDEDGIPQVIESRHVTFDESKFPGCPDLSQYMDDEYKSDHSYESKSESDADDSDASADIVSVDNFNDETGDCPALEESDSENDDIDDDDNGEDDPQDEDNSDVGDEEEFEDAQDTIVPPEPQQNQLTTQPSQPSRYPRRTRRKPQPWYMATSAQCDSNIQVTTSDEPTLREAFNATPQERALWETAIDEELDSLEFNNTWYPDEAPQSQPLPTHAILKVKRKADGTVERFKARIVAGGNHQTYGENYKETYAPVVSFTVVRIFLYLALCLRMCIGQLDVKSAFLKGDLDESVWVMSPRGIPGLKSVCYRLIKAMYGLKQAHLAWHKKLCRDLERLGFTELPSAPCVFRRKGANDVFAYVLVYVDDILVLAQSIAERDQIMEELKSLYDLRISEKVDLFLGVQLKWKLDSHGRLESLAMLQPLYTQGMLRRFGLQNSKPAHTPMVEKFFSGLAAEENKSVVFPERYQQMVGSLLYLALRSRPDITAAVVILARFQKAPTAYCHRATKRVLRYLQGTCGHGLVYSRGSSDLNVFVDSDYAGDTVDRKSMSGYVLKLGDACVSWGSKKQSSVALSTCEAEYYALVLAAQEILWMKRVLSESGIEQNQEVVPVRSDNQGAIGWANSDKCPSGRAKHIDVRVHFIRELVQKKTIHIEYVESDDNDADIFTKPLGPGPLWDINVRLGLGGEVEEEC